MSKLSTYKQLTAAPADLFGALSREIGLKTSCIPFAVKAIGALKSLGKLTESEALNAANLFLADLQTLNQGGIIAEDYDKTDFVKRGKTIRATARVEAFYRAAARKGYRITDTIVAVPAEDMETTYFKENFYKGEIVYTLEDRRINGDRKITAERIIGNYFGKFICRLEVVEVQTNKRVAMSVCEMPNDEIINIANVSEQGFYKTRWEKYTNEWGYERNRKVISDEINRDTFWILWTGEMVNKTIIRRALKRVKEVLPELREVIYAFESDGADEPTEDAAPAPVTFEIPMERENVDLERLTSEQKADVKETLELFKANPKLAIDKTEEIKDMLERGAELQEVINLHYASILNIKKSKKLYPKIRHYFEPVVEEAPKAGEPQFEPAAPAYEPTMTEIFCTVCGQEITSEKSKQYYAANPNHTVLCYDCNSGTRRKGR